MKKIMITLQSVSILVDFCLSSVNIVIYVNGMHYLCTRIRHRMLLSMSTQEYQVFIMLSDTDMLQVIRKYGLQVVIRQLLLNICIICIIFKQD